MATQMDHASSMVSSGSILSSHRSSLRSEEVSNMLQHFSSDLPLLRRASLSSRKSFSIRPRASLSTNLRFLLPAARVMLQEELHKSPLMCPKEALGLIFRCVLRAVQAAQGKQSSMACTFRLACLNLAAREVRHFRDHVSWGMQLSTIALEQTSAHQEVYSGGEGPEPGFAMALESDAFHQKGIPQDVDSDEASPELHCLMPSTEERAFLGHSSSDQTSFDNDDAAGQGTDAFHVHDDAGRQLEQQAAATCVAAVHLDMEDSGMPQSAALHALQKPAAASADAVAAASGVAEDEGKQAAVGSETSYVAVQPASAALVAVKSAEQQVSAALEAANAAVQQAAAALESTHVAAQQAGAAESVTGAGAGHGSCSSAQQCDRETFDLRSAKVKETTMWQKRASDPSTPTRPRPHREPFPFAHGPQASPRPHPLSDELKTAPSSVIPAASQTIAHGLGVLGSKETSKTANVFDSLLAPEPRTETRGSSKSTGTWDRSNRCSLDSEVVNTSVWNSAWQVRFTQWIRPQADRSSVRPKSQDATRLPARHSTRVCMTGSSYSPAGRASLRPWMLQQVRATRPEASVLGESPAKGQRRYTKE
eukprot:TRINITY_DN67067_c0_g1_i1.p1 TRINITY_DN67067_c0_g1~~TRINITY_DN67067_c0_g1_i1.p1  ORF type:complete len:593 (+),score=90.29 TRINITY_DN67067_c0_g1_i1:24-1802(+)